MTPILVPCVLCPRNEHEIQSVWASNGELRWWPGELAAVSLWESRCVSPAQGTFCLSAPLLCCDPTLVAQTVKNLSAYNAGDPDSIPGSKRRLWQPTPVLLPGESPGTVNPGVLQSMGLQRFRHDWATNTHKITLWIGKAGVSLSLSLSLSHTHTHTHTKKEQICMWSFHPFAPSPPPPSLSLGLAWSILIGLPKHATWAYSILRLWAFLFCDLRHDLPGTVLWGFFCIEVNSHMTSMLDCFHLDLFTCLLCFLG